MKRKSEQGKVEKQGGMQKSNYTKSSKGNLFKIQNAGTK
jgi:hypothetical protein